MDWDGQPLTREVSNGRQVVIQGQGYFTKCESLWGILPVM